MINLSIEYLKKFSHQLRVTKVIFKNYYIDLYWLTFEAFNPQNKIRHIYFWKPRPERNTTSFESFISTILD